MAASASDVSQESITPFKIVLVGDANTGSKTCLANRYVWDDFDDKKETSLTLSAHKKMAVFEKKMYELDIYGLFNRVLCVQQLKILI